MSPNYAGIIDGRIFYANCENETTAKRIAKLREGVVELFGVEIQTVDPGTKCVSNWKKKEGLSVWSPAKNIK